jgi:hypothetical protein
MRIHVSLPINMSIELLGQLTYTRWPKGMNIRYAEWSQEGRRHDRQSAHVVEDPGQAASQLDAHYLLYDARDVRLNSHDPSTVRIGGFRFAGQFTRHCVHSVLKLTS